MSESIFYRMAPESRRVVHKLIFEAILDEPHQPKKHN